MAKKRVATPKDDRASHIAMLNRLDADNWHLCGLDFWYWLSFVKTVDEDDMSVKPFPTNYDYLRFLDNEIETHQKVIVLKSRRLMASWLGMLRMLHAAMFAGSGIPETGDAFRGGVMSIGETEAKYLIERPTKVWNRLPEWMKRRNHLSTENQLLMQFENGGTIQAFPMKREGPRTFGFSRVFFDEMAFQEAARTTWMGMAPTLGAKGKLLAVSTPNGRTNLFHDIWSATDTYSGLRRVSVWWDGTCKIHEAGGVAHRFDPEIKAHSQEWLDEIEKSMDKQMFAREYLHSFASYAGSPVWNEFDFQTHTVPETDVIETAPMLIGWDFGFHYPAVTFWQYNGRDQFVGHREFFRFDVSFGEFCHDVMAFANTFYDRRKVPEIHFVDPAGFQRYHSRAQSGAISDVMEIKAVFGKNTQIRAGAMEVGTRNNEGPRLKEVRKLWKLRADGNPGIILNENMVNFIEGCQGGYAYPLKGGEQPEKNESSHLQDTIQYIVTGYKRMVRPSETKRVHRKPERIGRRTGV